MAHFEKLHSRLERLIQMLCEAYLPQDHCRLIIMMFLENKGFRLIVMMLIEDNDSSFENNAFHFALW